jgi:cytochrome c peroxidase
MGFAANAAPWDQYVAGDTSAISREAKQGAILFYGQARCAVCHAGSMFSDFQYHGVGIFSKITLNGKLVNDYGRWPVTGDERDRYKFRTPPLRNVTTRPLLFHDGSSSNLAQAIVRHVDPLARAGGYLPDGSFAMDRAQIQSVSPLLTEKIALTDDDVEALIAFLGTLASQSRDKSQIIPQRVPSGISFIR